MVMWVARFVKGEGRESGREVVARAVVALARVEGGLEVGGCRGGGGLGRLGWGGWRFGLVGGWCRLGGGGDLFFFSVLEGDWLELGIGHGRRAWR